MNYDIHVKQVPPQVVVTERCHATLAELGKVMQFALGNVVSSIEPPSAPRGAPFAVYYDEPFRPEDINLEVGFPVPADAKLTAANGVHRRELAGGPAAYTMHVGPYSAIGAAYDALYAWIDRHGHKRIGPPREIYIVGPGEGSKPEDYRTEIEVPID